MQESLVCGLQVIGVTGVNPSGSCLLASQLHMGTPLPLPATPPEHSARLARRTGAPWAAAALH